ncbi:hypothetical protein CkaCkLH20_09490 [Colletotrichum karsti]|uniref:tyrosinase n=1 Tax=Colletotrichum karsti TaxID=1095194 RepID=A0A9P6I6P0_9PEZI|nr:uncharacterized protein CkaCkLH20_09490 [Colletotrichum karsti]KAF9872980.1 hypothetical protein CkaCkLH20_09490 [Colletotrichum karsti]
MVRVRYSLQHLVEKYDTREDPTALQNLIRAFRIIQRLPHEHEDSFFTIAGYHGEPFEKQDQASPKWWGGYCQHGTVLFPTWHRAYLLRLEEALRNALPEADIALPFWDECRALESDDDPIPWVLTAPTFDLDGENVNPLYSYKLQKSIGESPRDGSKTPRYAKPAGYETVRYPLSGLVQEQKAAERHNSSFTDPASNARILNDNVRAWLHGKVEIDTHDDTSTLPDTYSVYSRYKTCLEAPNYTVFSNKESMAQYMTESQEQGLPFYGVAIEDPHNAIHLAVGGFFEKNSYNANPIRGANGDMGENETASFDPIFFLHHAFVDYIFWTWQRRRGLTEKGSLSVTAGYDGTVSGGNPVFATGTILDVDSPLAPFMKPNGDFFTSRDVTNIEDLGYTYGEGSFDELSSTIPAAPSSRVIAAVARVTGVSRSDYNGSFVIHTSAIMPDGNEVRVGRDAVLSRWDVARCGNCQVHLREQAFIPITGSLMRLLGVHDVEQLKERLIVRLQTRNGNVSVLPQVEIGLPLSPSVSRYLYPRL